MCRQDLELMIHVGPFNLGYSMNAVNKGGQGEAVELN